MPLLLVDMDDTLVDRAATAHRWAARHLPPWSQPVAQPLLRWLVRRFQAHRLVARPAAFSERTHPRSYVLGPGAREALEEVRRAGWSIAVITNGNLRTQPAKPAAAGIMPLMDAVVISSHEGFAKPDPRVFPLAAERAGASLEGAWVIGDDLRQEIARRHEAGAAVGLAQPGRSAAEPGRRPGGGSPRRWRSCSGRRRAATWVTGPGGRRVAAGDCR